MMLTPALRKRITILTAAVALLVCQSAAFAQWCVAPPGASGSVAAQLPCHAAGTESDPAGDGTPAACAEALLAEQAGFLVYDLADLPAMIVAAPDPENIHLRPAPEPPLLRTEPPPLRIVHCCLRN